MAFPCTANSDSIDVVDSGGLPQWNVNIAPTQTCVGGAAASTNALSIIGGAGLFVPATKCWSTGDGGASAPYFSGVVSVYERFPAGFGGVLPIGGGDLTCYSLTDLHMTFYNPTCHPMKVLVVARAILETKRPGTVESTSGMSTSFTSPAGFGSGTLPGFPLAIGGEDTFYINNATLYVTEMHNFLDAPALTIGAGGTADYYVQLYFGVTNFHGFVPGNQPQCDFWQFLLSAIGVEDVTT